MNFLQWLKNFDCEARAQVNLDHLDMGLEVTELQARFDEGLAPLAAFNEVQSKLNLLCFAEFTVGVA